jgi:hypothetical protein
MDAELVCDLDIGMPLEHVAKDGEGVALDRQPSTLRPNDDSPPESAALFSWVGLDELRSVTGAPLDESEQLIRKPVDIEDRPLEARLLKPREQALQRTFVVAEIDVEGAVVDG